MKLQMTSKQITLSAIAGAIVLAGAVFSAARTMWPVVGWVTPNAYAQDKADAEQQRAVEEQSLVSALEGISKSLTDFEDRWYCDELSEEIVYMRDVLGDLEPDTVEWIQQDEQLRAARDRWMDRDCSRFDD